MNLLFAILFMLLGNVNGSCPSYSVTYNGVCYATMDQASADRPVSGTICQDSYIPMPSGWALVPYSSGVVSNVVAKHRFGIVAVVFANGDAYYTAAISSWKGDLWGSYYLASNGSSYKAKYCTAKVLMMSCPTAGARCVGADKGGRGGDVEGDIEGEAYIGEREIERYEERDEVIYREIYKEICREIDREKGDVYKIL